MAQNEKAGMSETRSRTVAGGVTCKHVNSFQVLTKAETLQRCCQRPRRPATGQRRKESLEEEELLTPFSLIMNSALVLEICLHLKNNFLRVSVSSQTFLVSLISASVWMDSGFSIKTGQDLATLQ